MIHDLYNLQNELAVTPEVAARQVADAERDRKILQALQLSGTTFMGEPVADPIGDIYRDVVGIQLPDRSNYVSTPSRGVASVNGSEKTQKVAATEAQKENKKQETYEQMVRKYFAERNKIANDMQNRLKNLDESYAAQGPDLSSVAFAVDALGSGQGNALSNYQQTGYAKGRMSPQEYEVLKQKLQLQQAQNLGAMSDDAAYMHQLQMQNEQSALNRAAKLAAAKGKGQSLSGELIKRLDNVVGMDKSLNEMEKLTRSNDDQALKTFVSQNFGLAPDTKFGALLRNAAEYYGRMQSGGAIQREESKRFIMSMFKPNDSKQMRLYKFGLMRDMLRDRASSIAYGKDIESLPESLQRILKMGGNADTSLPPMEELEKMSEDDLKILVQAKKRREGRL